MNPMQAIQILDAAMGDNWTGEEYTAEQIEEAALYIHGTGFLGGALPGRYGRTVQAIMREREAGAREYHEEH